MPVLKTISWRNKSARSSAFTLEVIGRYLAALVYQSTITNIASYTDPCRVDGGSPIMKSIIKSCQAPSGTGNGASFP
jgi:hypothetical protein